MNWASIVSSIASMLGQEQEKEQGQKLTAAELARLDALGIPPPTQLVPEQLGTPEAAVADPRLQQALFAALNKMQQWGTGALTTEDKMALSLAEDEAARRGQIAQSGIEQQMQARGQGGQGAELAMKQQAAQGGQQAAYQAGLQNMLNARNRAFQATSQGASLASNMSAQDMARKQALDRIAAANAGARQSAQQYNLNVPWQQYQAGLDKEAVARGIGRVGWAGEQAANQGMRTSGANIAAGVDAYGRDNGWWGGKKSEYETEPTGQDADGNPTWSI